MPTSAVTSVCRYANNAVPSSISTIGPYQWYRPYGLALAQPLYAPVSITCRIPDLIPGPPPVLLHLVRCHFWQRAPPLLPPRKERRRKREALFVAGKGAHEGFGWSVRVTAAGRTRVPTPNKRVSSGAQRLSRSVRWQNNEPLTLILSRRNYIKATVKLTCSAMEAENLGNMSKKAAGKKLAKSVILPFPVPTSHPTLCGLPRAKTFVIIPTHTTKAARKVNSGEMSVAPVEMAWHC